MRPRPLLLIALKQAGRIRFLTRLTERQATHIAMLQRRLVEQEAWDPNAEFQAENAMLRERVALLADLCDPDRRRMASLVLKTIEEL